MKKVLQPRALIFFKADRYVLTPSDHPLVSPLICVKLEMYLLLVYLDVYPIRLLIRFKANIDVFGLQAEK